jgi:hypothetical protein
VNISITSIIVITSIMRIIVITSITNTINTIVITSIIVIRYVRQLLCLILLFEIVNKHHCVPVYEHCYQTIERHEPHNQPEIGQNNVILSGSQMRQSKAGIRAKKRV